VEVAPSVVREDEPTAARTAGMIGILLVLIGGLFLALNLADVKTRLGITMSSMLFALGTMGTLIHAAYDRELQVRRLYWGLGLALLVVGMFACVLPVDGVLGAWFGAGYPAVGLALLFLLATLHHETDVFIRLLTVRLLGIVGVAGIALTLVLGN